MRLYCYTYFADKILQEGYLSVAANPTPNHLEMYARKAGSEDFEDIKKDFAGADKINQLPDRKSTY